MEFNLHKLAGLVHVTTELLEDSPISMQPLLTQQFGAAIAFQEDEDFINGTGAGQPLGILNGPGLVTVAKEAGQPNITIVTENIIKMWSRLHPRSQASSVWIANSDSFPQLATMTLNVGTGGSSVGLMQIANGGLPNAPAQTLMGRPLILTEHCQTLGTKGDLYLCDWRQYLIGMKAGDSAVKFASSIHLKFDYDETAFRFVMRYDGQPWESSTLTPKHSTATLGSFVCIDDRS